MGIKITMKLLRPICGGNFDPNAESTSDGKNKLAKELNTKRELLHKGVHELGPWDCSGELEVKTNHSADFFY